MTDYYCTACGKEHTDKTDCNGKNKLDKFIIVDLIPKFDPDLSPAHSTNKQAARIRKLRFNGKQYVDVDGCPCRDKFGQPF